MLEWRLSPAETESAIDYGIFLFHGSFAQHFASDRGLNA